jgi:hypothetical protein
MKGISSREQTSMARECERHLGIRFLKQDAVTYQRVDRRVAAALNP